MGLEIGSLQPLVPHNLLRIHLFVPSSLYPFFCLPCLKTTTLSPVQSFSESDHTQTRSFVPSIFSMSSKLVSKTFPIMAIKQSADTCQIALSHLKTQFNTVTLRFFTPAPPTHIHTIIAFIKTVCMSSFELRDPETEQ